MWDTFSKWFSSRQKILHLDQPLSFTINLLFHVFILLTFLTIFFFKYISKLTESHLDSELKSMISIQTDQFMLHVDKQDTQKLIRWDVVNNLSTNMIRDSKQNVQYIADNNENLYNNSMCVLYMFVVLIIMLVTYFMFRGVDLNLKFILLENFVIFAFVGMIEIYFFLNIASKYIPILPDDVAKSVFSRLKYNISKSS